MCYVLEQVQSMEVTEHSIQSQKSSKSALLTRTPPEVRLSSPTLMSKYNPKSYKQFCLASISGHVASVFI